MSTELQVGQVTALRRALSQSDFDRFAALSGDDNPIHVNSEFAARTKFRRTVAHGMFLYGLVCSVLGGRLPGSGTIQIEQEMMFPCATFVDEEVEITAKVSRVPPDEGIAELETLVLRFDGSRGLQGSTLVRLPGRPGTGTRPPAANPASQAWPCQPAPYYRGLEVGQQAETRRVFSASDLAEYADLSGDTNSIYAAADLARQMGAAAPLIPGPLLGGMFSCLLGTRLPGPGTNYLKQRLHFLAPARPGQELRAVVEITRLRPEKHLVNLRTVCTNLLGETVCQGEALVMVSDVGVEP